MLKLGRDLAATPGRVRAFLAAALMLGCAQQIFVTTRNPWLFDAGWAPQAIAPVQATGAAAGILAGLFAGWLARGWQPAVLLGLCCIGQAVGFTTQVASPAVPTMLLAGAAVAGFGIQLQTAVGPAFLHSSTNAQTRSHTFAAWHIALFPLAGLACAGVVGIADATSGDEAQTQSLALTAAGAISLAALVPVLFIGHRPQPVSTRTRLRATAQVRWVVTIFALIGFSGGMAIPFLQLYFKTRFGIPASGIAGIYALGLTLATAGYLLGPRLAARLGLGQTASGTLLVAAPMFALLAWTPLLPVAIVLFVSQGVCLRIGAPLFQQMGQRLVPPGDGPAVAGYAVLGQSAAWATGSLAAGPILSLSGGSFSILLTVAGTLFLFTGLWSRWIFRRLERHTLATPKGH